MEEVKEIVKQKQKTYKAAGMDSETLTSMFRFDWQHGQGF